MRENCLDIGTIQAFLDAELSRDENAAASAHLAKCDDCALMLAEAEEESSIVFPALEREMNSLVPTQRLWNKINDSIREEKENRPVWEKAWAFIRVSFASPSMIAAASLLIVFGIFGTLWINKSRIEQTSPNIAATRPAAATSAPTTSQASPIAQVSTAPVDEKPEAEPTRVSGPYMERAVYRPEPRRQSASPQPAAVTAAYMPGEESYIRTISTLAKTVDPQKDELLPASERLAYERDMAVVNDTISKMRNEVRRNPRNETAKQILYSSYQNKIDLLSSVAQKEELVASFK